MVPASAAISRRVVAAEGDRRLAEIAPEIEARGATHCLILAEGKVRGIVRLRELAAASSLRLLCDLAVPCPSVEHDAPLAGVAEIFRGEGIDGVAVLRAGTVVGLITLDSLLQRLLEEQTQLAAERLEASRAKDNFLAALSHELRTPLNPVLLLASAAADNPKLAPEIREDFAFIRKHVELEARLIDDLLDLTRITEDRLVLRLFPMEARLALSDALDIVAGDLEAKRITLTVQWPPAGVQIAADPVRLQQVYWNVLKNAVKFTPEGGQIRLEAALSADQRRLIVRVIDSGIGLRAAELETIFAAFAQGEHTREGRPHRFGGLGLGLAISRKLVELHGGRIFATSDGPQRGSTFVIDLPVLTAG
jgi:signal transduction histidine kinase